MIPIPIIPYRRNKGNPNHSRCIWRLLSLTTYREWYKHPKILSMNNYRTVLLLAGEHQNTFFGRGNQPSLCKGLLREDVLKEGLFEYVSLIKFDFS